MTTLKEYRGQKPAWCPGCGNFGILTAFNRAMFQLGVEPWQFVDVAGIGQAGKFPHYTNCNAFNGLHGRTLPVAFGIRMANREMPVVASAGDGDCYGEGANHWLAAIRRNADITLLVHDNQVYGLTKGQASPTSLPGMKTPVTPEGVVGEALNPVAAAVALGCGFVARGFSGDVDQLAELITAAYTHKGFAMVDIFQPCVTFNKLNTYDWYRERCYHVDNGYDPSDREAALKKASELGERIPTGILYRVERPVFEDTIGVTAGKPPLVRRAGKPAGLEDTVAEFY